MYFGHAEIFKKYFSQSIFFGKESETSFGIFGNILFVENGTFKIK
jgi:hypothetical protein